MQFRGTTITFNTINSSRYGLYLCNVTGDFFTRQFGATRSIETEHNSIKTITQDKPTIEIQLVKLDNNNNPSPLTEEELNKIARWLFSPQEYKPLMVDRKNVVYYGIFTDGQIWQNEANQGYLTLQFELNANHAYTVVNNSDFRVSDTSIGRDIVVTSYHTFEMYNEVDMEISLFEGNSFTVINHTTGQTMELKNLPSNCRHIYIYNDGVKHIENVDNKEQNIRGSFNKVFIHLAYGVNNITIKGQGTVRFISQGKLLLT